MYLLPLALGLAAAPYVAGRIPEQYRSDTVILVVPQRIPEKYVVSTVTIGVAGRLRSISEQILSRSRLERLITELDLYAEERATGFMEDVIQRVRTAITIELDGVDSFKVSYVSTDPVLAQRVTQRIASMVIEENLRERESLADGTSEFIESQLVEAKDRLLQHEKKLEQYRQQHAGELPSQLQSNLQAIQGAHLQLQAINEALNRARERRLLIERQIADVELLPPAVRANGGGETASPEPAAQQLEAARARLQGLQLRYTPDHPDIRALQRAIRDLEQKAVAEARRVPSETPDVVLSPAELVRDKRLSDLRADLRIVDGQIASAQDSESQLRRTIQQYQAKVDLAPTRESELIELTRDYATLQDAYTGLLEKREQSKLAANLERQQIGEQFKILDDASLPERPFNKLQRIGYSLSAAGAGLILGLALAGFLEYRDSTFTRGEEVERLLSVPVLGLIPSMLADTERRRLQRRRWAVNVAGVCILIGSLAVLALWPLRL
jgi:polysaccharide chain length determinant protein (PEP-CTERM system associated)